MNVRAFFALLFFISQAGCAPFESANNSASFSSFGSGTIDTNAKLECQFIGPDVLSSRIKNILEIAAGDVPTLNQNGQPTQTMRLASNLQTLGKGNVAQGRFDDLSCGTTKFKTSIEIMVDACDLALTTNTSVRSKLFPSGLTDFDELYRTFVGRLPTAYEAQVLRSLISGVSNQKAEAAACAAVASSLESLVRI